MELLSYLIKLVSALDRKQTYVKIAHLLSFFARINEY